MIQAALGIIDKMRIEVFEKNDYSKDPKKTIFVQVNPEKYNIKHNVVFCEGQPMGATGADLKYNKTEPEEVGFEFLFDSSGVIPKGKIKDGKGKMSFLDKAGDVLDALKPAIVNPFAEVKSVEEDLEEFKKLLMGYNGETHHTAYLQLLWGGYSLQCRLKSMEVEYYLFLKDGRPIRAKAKCVFKGTIAYKTMLQEQKKSSPDLTHQREFEMNDKLPLMAENIYENQNYYIDVAKSNGVLSFRNVSLSKKIIFPPIK
jgi:Contractile injection system tube protein